MRSESGEAVTIGRPARVLDEAVRAGDRLLRSSPAEGVVYSAVVQSEVVESAAGLAARGIPVEWAGPGGYVEVLELGDHLGARRSVGRRLTDASGRMPWGQMVLRPAHEGWRAPRPRAWESVEQQATGVVCQLRPAIVAAARAEEARWTGPNGVKLVESDPSQRDILEQYWSAVPGYHTAAAAATKAQRSASHATGGEWSAAFICFVLSTAGVHAVHGFEFSERHLRYIVGALRNRERSQRGRPFWLVDHVELEHEATPEPGDLVCFNRCVERPNHQDPGCAQHHVWTRHNYETLRRRFWLGGNQNVVPTGSAHCSLVVGTAQQGSQRRLELIGGNEADSVRVRTHVPIDADGHVVNPLAHHVFGMIKIIGC